MVEIACKEAVFHFNKAHLSDPTIPMWVIKTGGKTYYVNHVECRMGWSTKETPDNPHTKGSIKVKNAFLSINDANEAEMRPLTQGDLSRIRAAKRHYARIMITNRVGEIKEFCQKNDIPHGEFKKVQGSCGSSFTLVDIKTKEGLALLSLTFDNTYRILQANEIYFKAYEDPELLATLDADGYYDGEEDDDDLD